MTIETINAQKSLVIPSRTVFKRPFNVGDWTDLRIGMWVSVANNTNFTAAPTQEVISNSTANRMLVGLLGGTGLVASDAGTNFIGLQPSAAGGTGGVYIRYNGSKKEIIGYINTGDFSFAGTCADCRYIGAAETISARTTPVHHTKICNVASLADANYADFIDYRLVVTNKGTASQTITSYRMNAAVAATSTPTIATILSNLALAWNFNGGSDTTVAWNDGVSARPLPDSLYIRWPFFQNRLVIHSMVVQKAA